VQNPNEYRFIIVNDRDFVSKNLKEEFNKTGKPAAVGQGILEIEFNVETGFNTTPDSQVTGILLAKRLFEVGNHTSLLQILNTIDMREVIALGNGAFLFETLSPFVSYMEGSAEFKLAKLKCISLLLESDPYKFPDLLIVRKEDGSIDSGASRDKISNAAESYQALVEARENSTTIATNLSKEEELKIMEALIEAMSQVINSNPMAKRMINCMSESTLVKMAPEIGLLKLLEQRHQKLVREFGIKRKFKYTTKVERDLKVMHVSAGAKRFMKSASRVASRPPGRT
jgi:hypothetical protein